MHEVTWFSPALPHKMKSRCRIFSSCGFFPGGFGFSLCPQYKRKSFGVNIDKEGWAPKNWFFQTVVLEKTLENPLDSEEIKPVNPKGNQSWIFIGRTGAEGEAPILWPPDVKSWLIRKDPDSAEDWRQEKGAMEDEMVGWHHWLSGHEFEETQGESEGQGSMVCCS